MDSRSKVLLHDFKQQKTEDFNYEILLKSVTYNLLGYLLEKLDINVPNKNAIFEKDHDAILKSQEFLLSNLIIPFPGIEILAKSANMSITKFKYAYRNVYGTSPAVFFRNEKLLLSRELLQSGKFNLVSEVASKLGYYKLAYFSVIYKKFFGVSPTCLDLTKKNEL